MTEDEWLVCERPYLILQQFASGLSARKLRLFSCACCRRFAPLVHDPRHEEILDGLERYADGAAKEAERRRASTVQFEVVPGVSLDALTCLCGEIRQAGSRTMSRVADRLGEQAAAAVAYTDMGRFWPTWLQELQRQAALLRDIMGNPFRPVRPGPRWLTSAVVSLATASYADRTFDHLPILADALEEAGCANADVLAHCRNGGPHVRGCWVVDLVLGKG